MYKFQNILKQLQESKTTKQDIINWLVNGTFVDKLGSKIKAKDYGFSINEIANNFNIKDTTLIKSLVDELIEDDIIKKYKGKYELNIKKYVNLYKSTNNLS